MSAVGCAFIKGYYYWSVASVITRSASWYSVYRYLLLFRYHASLPRATSGGDWIILHEIAKKVFMEPAGGDNFISFKRLMSQYALAYLSRLFFLILPLNLSFYSLICFIVCQRGTGLHNSCIIRAAPRQAGVGPNLKKQSRIKGQLKESQSEQLNLSASHRCKVTQMVNLSCWRSRLTKGWDI